MAAGTVNAVTALFCFQLLADTVASPKSGIGSAGGGETTLTESDDPLSVHTVVSVGSGSVS